MVDFKNVKITDEIIIVEKTYSYNGGVEAIKGGYVVDPTNKQMLETALSWAKSWVRKINKEDGSFIYDERGNYVTEMVEGKVHRYKNGTFKLEILDAAGESSQGGKLSFWNCLITAPDKKVFKVGINAALLLEVIRENTFEKSKCNEDIWLGRIKGQVGAFTKNMEVFKKLHERKAFEEQKPTTKYNKGDILRTMTHAYIYLGEITEYFSIQNLFYDSNIMKRVYNNNLCAVVDKKPVKYHTYLDIAIDEDFDENDIKSYLELTPRNYYKWSLLKEDKKLSRVVIGHLDETISTDYFDYKKKLLDSTLKKADDGFAGVEKELARLRKTEPDVRVEDTYLHQNVVYFEYVKSKAEFDLFVNELDRKFDKEGFKNNEATKDYLQTISFPTINNKYYISTHRTDSNVSPERKVLKILLEKDYIKYYNETQEIQAKFHKASPYVNPAELPTYLNGRKYK